MFAVGTSHIGPHLWLSVVMETESRFIISYRFGKSNSEKLVKQLCEETGLVDIPPKSRLVSSFFGSLKDYTTNFYIFNNNDEIMECVSNGIEYYNFERVHSSIGYITPAQKFHELNKDRNQLKLYKGD
ncbi:MAG: integrase core domain-containing protein [Sphaerochaetaceae bacterium]|nr:integrase core domain-containing protein [Sphaerochaetaceae bacterium]